VGPALLEEPVGGGPVGVKVVGLEHDVAVPVDAEPAQRVEDVVDELGAGPLAVGVLDPQEHLAAEAAGLQPVEQRGPGVPDVQEAGGGRREAEPGRGRAHWGEGTGRLSVSGTSTAVVVASTVDGAGALRRRRKPPTPARRLAPRMPTLAASASAASSEMLVTKSATVKPMPAHTASPRMWRNVVPSGSRPRPSFTAIVVKPKTPTVLPTTRPTATPRVTSWVSRSPRLSPEIRTPALARAKIGTMA